MTAVADREDAPPGGPASGKPGRQSRGLHAALTVVRLGPVL